MSERDTYAAGENAVPDRGGQGQRPNLIDRLRLLFGLGGPTIRDELQEALSDTATDAEISPQQRTMLKNVLGLHEVRVEDVMVPRTDIIAVSLDSTLAEVLDLFRSAGHSRLPVHGDTLDDPRGMVHIRDFVDYLAGLALPETETVPSHADKTPPAVVKTLAGPYKLDIGATTLAEAKILRPVLFVPPSMPVLDLLVKMQATRTHMALVIDEYGGTDGLASIEDIVEMIVGDIEDEHDLEESPKIEATEDGAFIVDARADLEEVGAVTGIDFEAMDVTESFDTLGGLITAMMGHVPVRGEMIEEGTLSFEILDADRQKIERIKIYGAPGGRVGEETGYVAEKGKA
ncbi:hemolysin family protein [Beijerinckia indica]|uniref:CBS domain containing protein n=1 Tax=Beijerinckia indica subsp. indica (strain ATCC 9039 / DSM 1715 / NCIMB 8712) TaxID=395963 RepID=B2IIK8_BEII9|nr:hemolysin family protein [Beijerinckia indica]ACB94701.1 CBS domain containing protein [Beijerinckia indica subsp. indica ATCC 9039]